MPFSAIGDNLELNLVGREQEIFVNELPASSLARRDLRLWPSPHGRPIGRDRRFEIINAGDVLDDVVTGTIPNIDAEREVGLRLHGAVPASAMGALGGRCYQLD